MSSGIKKQMAALIVCLASACSATILAMEKPQPVAPELASVFAAVAPVDHSEELLLRHHNMPVAIASITKLMTAMVILDSKQPLEEWLLIHKPAYSTNKNAYSRMRIQSRAKREDLLLVALMSSENLATHTLAQHYPGGLDAFVDAMNHKAQSLGMHHTHFVDPAGLSPKNTSTTADLLLMARAAYAYPDIRRWSTSRSARIHFRSPHYVLNYGNTNPLVHSHRWNVFLSKTGYLKEAGRCLLMIVDIDNQPHILVLLNSLGTRSPLGDAGRIRRWIEDDQRGKVAAAARDYAEQRVASFSKK